ncbi:MAG: polysaccharide biosynthesis/export family protein [Candidatus Methylacidiphilales bacterium]|nr:polysaccharide biosynthesis/export family protein [Candidatus Methylacidiphilales bacterium]
MKPPLGIAWVLLMVLFSGCAGLGGGASRDSSSSFPTVTPTVGQDSEGNDLLRVGDSLSVQLSGVPAEEAYVQQMKVDESGSISLPYIGGIKVTGMTTVMVKERIETLYKLGRFYTTPNVTVTSQQSRFINVTGDVRSPQRIFYAKDLTVMGAIATCGGFTDYSNKRAVKLLRGKEIMLINAVEVLKDPSKDVPLLPDDIIQVDRSIF